MDRRNLLKGFGVALGSALIIPKLPQEVLPPKVLSPLEPNTTFFLPPQGGWPTSVEVANQEDKWLIGIFSPSFYETTYHIEGYLVSSKFPQSGDIISLKGGEGEVRRGVIDKIVIDSSLGTPDRVTMDLVGLDNAKGMPLTRGSTISGVAVKRWECNTRKEIFRYQSLFGDSVKYYGV